MSDRHNHGRAALLVNSTAQQAQTDVLAQRERSWSVDRGMDLAEVVRLVVVRHGFRRSFRRNVGLSQGHVQQTRCGLPQLATDE